MWRCPLPPLFRLYCPLLLLGTSSRVYPVISYQVNCLAILRVHGSSPTPHMRLSQSFFILTLCLEPLLVGSDGSRIVELFAFSAALPFSSHMVCVPVRLPGPESHTSLHQGIAWSDPPGRRDDQGQAVSTCRGSPVQCCWQGEIVKL